MNYKTLLLGTIFIATVTYGAFVAISPKADLTTTETESVQITDVSIASSTDLSPTSTSESQRESKTLTIEKERTDSTPIVIDSNPQKKPVTESVLNSSGVTGYTLAEVAKHTTETDCWTAVNGQVYNLSPYIKKHPGGKSNIMRICGIDGTNAFENQHGGQSKPENVLAGLEIGVLK